MSRERFKLPDHVLARRYVATKKASAAGVAVEETFIILNDQGDRGPRTLSIGEREWTLIEGMDGTRDIAGLVASARERGANVDPTHAEAFVRELHREALVIDVAAVGVEKGDASLDRKSQQVAAPQSPVAREAGAKLAIEQMPGFALRCDGRGSCCRLYPSVLFSPLDAARARSTLPLVRGAGEDEPRAFLPERGTRRDALAVTLVDGRCAYLGAKGHCGIHEAAGALAKPLGCRLFPAAFVDDSISIRVSPVVECACVLASAIEPGDGGSPLVDPSAHDMSALDPRIFVDQLPDEIVLSADHSIGRARYVAWSRAIEHAKVVNGPAGLLALSSALESGLPTIDQATIALATNVCADVSVLIPYVRALRARAERRADETWRSGRDLARQAFVAIVAAAEIAETALDTLVEPAPRTASAETFYVQAAWFGHHFVSRSMRVPLAVALRDRALRVVLGRSLAVVASIGGLTDPAFAAPLALVEAVLRGHGLAAYVLDL